MKYTYQDWIHDPNQYDCPSCGGSSMRVCGLAGSGVQIECTTSECERANFKGGRVLESVFDGAELIHFLPPEDWIEANDRRRIEYHCPYCESEETERIPYDDGCGNVDVKIDCINCEESTWE